MFCGKIEEEGLKLASLQVVASFLVIILCITTCCCFSFQSLVSRDPQSSSTATSTFDKLGGAVSLSTINRKTSPADNIPGPAMPVSRSAGWAVCFDNLLQDGAGVATFTVSAIE